MDYSSRVKELMESTIRLLRDASTTAARRQTIVEYLQRGFEDDFTSGELADYFYVSTPNIMEEAGYNGAEADLLAKMFDEEHERLGRR